MSRRPRLRPAAGLLVACALLLASSVAAQTGAAPDSGASSVPAGELADVLRARVGKTVTLLLTSGKEYGGTVGEVRNHSLVLRNITGKEFFDSLVQLDDVVAVEIRRDR